MTLYLQEELFSLDHFDIWDEDGNVKYQVERELFQFGRKLVVVDTQGREAARPAVFVLHAAVFHRPAGLGSLGELLESGLFHHTGGKNRGND